MARRHIVISGTGRAGTTFLVEILTHLGLDTGFTPETLAQGKLENSRAGLEFDIRFSSAPYVVKNPHFCVMAEEVLADKEIFIEHVIIPMRDLYAAAESRRFVRSTGTAKKSWIKRMAMSLNIWEEPGGLWRTEQGHEQEILLLQKWYKLALALSGEQIPVTLLRFPKLTSDPLYLFAKLKPVIGDITIDQFKEAFAKVANPKLVHSFSAEDH